MKNWTHNLLGANFMNTNNCAKNLHLVKIKTQERYSYSHENLVCRPNVQAKDNMTHQTWVEHGRKEKKVG